MSEAGQEEPTAGSMLRSAREAAGLHVAALAVLLKVPVRKLELLEADRYDELPDAVFVRALASSMCRTLKIDPQPVLGRLPQTAAPRLVQTRDGINTPFRAPSDAARPSTWSEHLSRPVSMAVLALLLGVVVMIFLPSFQLEDVAAPAKSEVGAPMAAPVVVESVPASAEPEPVASGAGGSAHPAPVAPSVALASAAAPAAAMPASAPKEVNTVPAAIAVSTPTTTAVTTAAATPAMTPAKTVAMGSTTAAAPALAMPPAPGLVVFRARGSSWVEVTDSKGAVALRKLMAAGESVGVSGTLPLPLAVTVGSSSDTTVEVRGRPFDLNPVSKDNVARFEVK